MAQRSTEFEEKSKQEVFDEPESSDGAIVEDSRTLHLHQAGGVVEVDSDCSRHTVIITDGEPENPIEFNSFVVKARLDV